MRRLVVLRPEPGASATVARARKLGLDALAMPLFAIRPLAWDAPDPGGFDALLLTSANAVRQAGDKLASYRSLPVWAVGQSTAAAAREAGFVDVTPGEGGVEALLAAIPRGLRLLHLAGRDRAAVAGPGQAITVVPVYAADALDEPGDLSLLEGAVALVHSARAGRRLAELAADRGIDRRSVRLVAISEAAAQAAGSGWAEVAVAAIPGDSAMLALAAALCDGPAPT